MIWEHCPPLCWPLLGVERKHYWLSFSRVLLSFVQYIRWTTKTLTWPTQCALVCVFETFGFERVMSVRARVHDARWCTGCSLWLMSPVFGRGMHYQQFIYTLCEYILPSPTHILRTYALDATCSSPINPVFIFRLNRQMPWSFSPRLIKRVCVCVCACVWGGVGGDEVRVWPFGHFKCVWCSLT